MAVKLPAPGQIAGEIDLGAQTARRIMKVFQERRDRPARFEFRTQVLHHALDFADHDRDRRCIGRFGDPGDLVAFRGAGRNTNELPRRRQPAHDQDKGIDEDVGLGGRHAGVPLLCGCGFKQRFDRIDLVAFERAQMIGQTPRQIVQQIAVGENAGHRRQIVQRPGRADLHGEAPARLVVAGDRRNGVADAQQRAIMQGTRHLLGFEAIIVEQGAIDILGQRPGLGRNQIAADPFPDRFERHACNPPGALVIGGIINDERLNRREEQAGGIADTRHRLAGSANGAPEFLQDELAAGGLFAAQ